MLGLHAEGQLGATAGLVVSGDAGVGKSSTLNHAIACCEQAGWLVVVVPSATDWTHGLDGRDTVAPCEAYRITDREYFTHVLELEAAAEEAAAAAEAEGDHWAKAAAVTYEAPDASANFLVALAFSQMEKLDKLPVKDAERRAHYARPGGGEPSLGDMLRKFSRDECAAPAQFGAIPPRNSLTRLSVALCRYKGFAEFPMALRPVHDLLRELQTVTDIPVLVAVDGWNRWHQMSGARVAATGAPGAERDAAAPRAAAPRARASATSAATARGWRTACSSPPSRTAACCRCACRGGCARGGRTR